MKKVLFSLLVLFGLFCLNANAQFGGSTDAPVRKSPLTPGIGLKVGGTATQITGDLNSYTKLGDGFGIDFEAGALFHLRFGSSKTRNSKSPLALQAEVLYKRNKAKTTGDDDLLLNYLEIPVMLQLYPFNGKKFLDGLYLEVGPSFGVCLSSSPEELVLNTGMSLSTGKLKANDVRVGMGLGYRANKGLGVNLRYYLGTSELAKNIPCKSSGLEFALSYTFMFGKK